MKLNIVRKSSFGAPPWGCILISVPVVSIPNVLGALLLRSSKYWWIDADSAKYGRWAIGQEMEAHLMDCGKDIVDALDRLYRQQEAIHRGTVYTVDGIGTSEDPYVFTPDIPLVPAIAEGEQPSVLFYLAKSMRLLDNYVNGTTYADAPDARNIRDQLDTIIAAIEAGGYDDTEVLARLASIIAALA